MTDSSNNDWIEHDGKGMPVDGDVLVTVRDRSGYEFRRAHPADFFSSQDPAMDFWINFEPDGGDDITHYRIVKGNDNG